IRRRTDNPLLPLTPLLVVTLPVDHHKLPRTQYRRQRCLPLLKQRELDPYHLIAAVKTASRNRVATRQIKLIVLDTVDHAAVTRTQSAPRQVQTAGAKTQIDRHHTVTAIRRRSLQRDLPKRPVDVEGLPAYLHLLIGTQPIRHRSPAVRQVRRHDHRVPVRLTPIHSHPQHIYPRARRILRLLLRRHITHRPRPLVLHHRPADRRISYQTYRLTLTEDRKSTRLNSSHVK